jgi:hypothetical protein
MSAQENIVLRTFKQIGNVITPVILESARILPDSVVLGTAILSAISLSKSYAILLFTMVELMIIQRISATIIGSIAPIAGGKDALQRICEPGFQYPNLMRISLLETIGVPSMFPSPVMFFFSGILSYLICAMQQFGKEIKSFNSDIGVRTTLALFLSFTFMLLMVLFRYTYGCETPGSIITSLVLGYIVGIALVFQNEGLFGRDGINVLNLPMIESVKGKPLYVCAPSN